MTRILKTGAALLALSLAGLTGLTGCTSTGSSDSGGAVTLDYWLWDDNQKASYQACADAFHTANPDITITITQTAWAQYWQNLTTQLAAGDAPDVWTNQASYYPQFVTSNQILDIQPFVDRDKVDLTQYQAGLADLYAKDGKRYGLPKDWDTMALVYNTAQLTAQGIGPAELKNLTWNAGDGGTFEQLIAKATVDQQGRNGLDPAFDKTKIKTYGFLPEWADGSQGQNGWGTLPSATGSAISTRTPGGRSTSTTTPSSQRPSTGSSH